MDENGIWLSGTGPFSVNNSTFDYSGTGASANSTLFTLNGVTNSNILLTNVTYGKSRANTNNYNFTLMGTNTGLLWTHQQMIGPLAGNDYENNDLQDQIRWAAPMGSFFF